MKRKPLKLLSFIIILISLITLTMSLLFMFSTLWQFHSFSRESLTNFGTALNKSICFASADYLLTESYPPLSDVIDEFLDYQSVAEISIINHQEEIAGSSDTTKIGSQWDSETYDLPEEGDFIRFSDDNKHLIILGPVTLSDLHLGWTYTAVSLDSTREQLVPLLVRNGIIAFAIWLVSIFLGFMGGRQIIRPINSFIKSIDTFAKGDYAPSLDKLKIRELETVRKDFNNMADELSQREEELNKSRFSAEQANKTKSLILANISHELRTPLNGIIGFTQLLEHTSLSESQREYIENIKYSGDSLFSILRNILDYTELESGNIILQCKPVDLTELLTDIEGRIAVLIKNSDLKFYYSIVDKAQVVKGDKNRLDQIIMELLTNAVKFTKRGTITCRMSYDDMLSITVKDTGPGITREKQQEIFEIFKQAEDPLTKSARGIGTGLAIVKLLVNAMNGEITLESSPGKGCIFQVDLPLECSGEEGVVQIPDIDENRKNHILVVEDEAINQMFIRQLLEQHNYSTQGAKDGHTAVEIFHQNDFDMILMDIGLPGKNGIDTAKEIIKTPKYVKRKIPIIPVTANVQQEIRLSCDEAGMVDFVSKPVIEQKLLSVINTHMKKIK